MKGRDNKISIPSTVDFKCSSGGGWKQRQRLEYRRWVTVYGTTDIHQCNQLKSIYFWWGGRRHRRPKLIIRKCRVKKAGEILRFDSRSIRQIVHHILINRYPAFCSRLLNWTGRNASVSQWGRKKKKKFLASPTNLSPSDTDASVIKQRYVIL